MRSAYQRIPASREDKLALVEFVRRAVEAGD